jgi:hypothetical protein
MVAKQLHLLCFLKVGPNTNINNALYWSLIALMCFSFATNASNSVIEQKIDSIVSFDEVSVEFYVNGYYKFETNVIITDAKKLYINIDDLFNKLGIYCKVEDGGTLLKGFIENEKKNYSVDLNSRQIEVGNKIIKSNTGIVKKLGAIYLESTIITKAFGLTIIFNYRSLSIKLEANFELPLEKQMRLEQIRKNISKLQNKEPKVDKVVQREYHLFKEGMLDWSLASSQTKNETTRNRIGLGIGAELLYGQVNISINYNDQNKFDNRQLHYNWRWVDNDKKYFKQVEIGKIYNQSISFLETPVIGASINNTPNTVRKTGGYHTINEYTEPNWTVELYINDVLVDYTAADASGLYVFKVPIVYGYTTLTLKFYGPLGEERIEERTMNIPFTFIPPKKTEYSVSGGVLQDGENSKFGRAVVNYGVNRSVTIGGGFEYLSSIPNKPFIPFATIAFQPFSKLILNAEYAHSVRTKGLLNYNFGKSSFLEIEYVKYVDGQVAARFNANEERKANILLPFKMKKVSGYARLNYNQFVYNAFNFNQFDAIFSGYYKNFNANVSALLNWVSNRPSYITSNIALSYRIKNGFILRPSVEFNNSDNQLLRHRIEIEKRISKMYFSASYERNSVSKTDNFFLTFRYDLPFARAGFISSYSNNRLNFSENAQGSIAFGIGDGSVKPGYNSALGKGGILFYPFLDLNQNGKKDKGEQMVLLSNVKVNGGQADISKKDSIVRVSDLNSFINYNITFFDDDLDNVSWRFKYKSYQVLVDPHQYKRVDVPIFSVGEISGMIYLNKDNISKGLGRITIQVIDKKGNKVAETLSESDGYYNYLGLNPGEYTIRIDEKQLQELGYQASPSKHNITIKVSVDGAIIDALDFTMQSKKKLVEKSDVQKDATKIVATEVNATKEEQLKSVLKLNLKKTFEKDIKRKIGITVKLENKIVDSSFTNITYIKGLVYTVQIGAYRNTVTPKQLLNLSPIYYENLNNVIIRYLFGDFKTLKEAKIVKNKMKALGIPDACVVAYKDGVRVHVKTPIKIIE